MNLKQGRIAGEAAASDRRRRARGNMLVFITAATIGLIALIAFF